MRWYGKNAFTLVELLVVIAIISVLAALLLPVLEEALEASRRVVCSSQQRQMIYAATQYANDFNDCLPQRPSDATNRFIIYNWNSWNRGFWTYSEEYVGVALARWWVSGVNGKLGEAAAGNHSILRCPADPQGIPCLISYSLWGGYSACPDFPVTKLSKMAEPSKRYPGQKKIFIGDYIANAPRTLYIPSNTSYLFSHNRDGLNYGLMDASVKWADMDDTVGAMYTAEYGCRIPAGYCIYMGQGNATNFGEYGCYYAGEGSSYAPAARYPEEFLVGF